eukprot:CAMPEP_0179073552 /NCGR_PEP_ID=MMETSP0796-20121207/32628_1 /TAXON_ID=73915 /ORGANISM="Pyrodinium bahamense, Strain pbaha01" /LENGTH=328 /DNA_ID=CAMNT_0020770745 /DNA_START=41 /DNA_END=1027 /DNA_ORIENTATION=+
MAPSELASVRRVALVLAAAAATAHSVDEGLRTGYSEQEALEFAYLSTAAYCGAPRFSRRALEAWRCGAACSHVHGMRSARQVLADGNWADASALVGRLRGRCVVAFRGTADRTDWLEDLKSGWHTDANLHGFNCSSGNASCRVGSGWLAVYQAIRDYVRGNLSAIGCRPGARIAFAGHSLGAATAQLAMFDLGTQGYRVDRSYVFGSPRTGDASWAMAFEALFGSSSLYRVNLDRDPVPHVPMRDLGFVHASTEVFYKGNTSGGFVTCDMHDKGERCSGQYHHLSQLILGCVSRVQHCDHLRYMTARKVIPMDGASCVNDALMTEVQV